MYASTRAIPHPYTSLLHLDSPFPEEARSSLREFTSKYQKEGFETGSLVRTNDAQSPSESILQLPSIRV